MHEIVYRAKSELDALPAPASELAHMRTGDIRTLSARLYSSLEDKRGTEVFPICSELLKTRDWRLSVIAYDWAYRLRKQYRPETFDLFEEWLIHYVRGWGDCDDFCTHAFGELLCQYPELIDRILPWSSREEFWMRRAAAVILILPIRKDKYYNLQPYHIADLLMQDENYLVLKGYGWMLKVLSQKEPEAVYDYLLQNQTQMPRLAYRYALEKLSPDMKSKLMAGDNL